MRKIFIISAPSGAGKTSLVREICKKLSFIRPSVSFTTRKIRDSETDEKDYFFIDIDNFTDKINKKEFLEYQNVYGNLYGTTLDSISKISDQELDVILEIEADVHVSRFDCRKLYSNTACNVLINQLHYYSECNLNYDYINPSYCWDPIYPFLDVSIRRSQQ